MIISIDAEKAFDKIQHAPPSDDVLAGKLRHRDAQSPAENGMWSFRPGSWAGRGPLRMPGGYLTTGVGLVGKVMSLLLNMLSRLVITFLPRSEHLLISWLQSPSAVILLNSQRTPGWHISYTPLFSIKQTPAFVPLGTRDSTSALGFGAMLNSQITNEKHKNV